MRRIALLAIPTLLPGLLGACAGSGFYSYLGDTFTPPFGANPNGARGPSETYAKVGGPRTVTTGSNPDTTPAPILTEAGDVWPPAPKAPPTLKDLQRQQNGEMAGNGSPGRFAPLQPLPELPGYEVPQQQTIRPPPQASFPNGVVPLPNGQTGVITGGGGAVRSLNGPTGNGSIVVPNGNGTSTVIGPNGAVSTIPTPGK